MFINNLQPIFIYGDSNFAVIASQRNWTGDGSSANPYLIKNLNFAGTGNLIDIESTSVYFQISHNKIRDGYNGIYLANTLHASILYNNITANYYGINLYSAFDTVIAGNSFSKNQYGAVSLSSSNNNTISNNSLVDNNNGLNLANSNSNYLYQNNITIIR